MLRPNGLTIGIRNLRIPVLIGVFDAERGDKTVLNINIAAKLDHNRISFSDNLCDTVDYGALASFLRNWMEFQEPHLLEHLAHSAALKLLEFDRRIIEIDIEIFKPVCVHSAEGAFVKLSCSRNEP